MPVAPRVLSLMGPPVVGTRRAQGVALNSSILSWAKVAASVTELPEALLRVVVTIRPASASKEMDKITSVIMTSSRVKPSDFVGGIKANLLCNV